MFWLTGHNEDRVKTLTSYEVVGLPCVPCVGHSIQFTRTDVECETNLLKCRHMSDKRPGSLACEVMTVGDRAMLHFF